MRTIISLTVTFQPEKFSQKYVCMCMYAYICILICTLIHTHTHIYMLYRYNFTYNTYSELGKILYFFKLLPLPHLIEALKTKNSKHGLGI